MSNNKQSRKDFLKSLGVGVGAMTIVGSASASSDSEPLKILNSNELTPEQKALMVDYEEWLTRWHTFVIKRRENREDPEVQKELFAIAQEADKYRNDLDDYMQDPIFKRYYDERIKQITTDIGVI